MKRIFIIFLACLCLLMLAVPVFGLGTDDSGVRPYYNFFNYTVLTNAESVATYQVGNTSYRLKMVANGDGSLLSFSPVFESAPVPPANYTTFVEVSGLTWNDLFPFTGPEDRLYWSRGTIGTTCELEMYIDAGSLGKIWASVPLNVPFNFTDFGITYDTPVRFRVSFNWAGQCNIFSPGMYKLSSFDEVDESKYYDNDVQYSKDIFVSYNKTLDDYGNPYNEGYQQGFQDGEANRQQAYQDGVVAGESVGYDKGYAQGVADSGSYTFLSLMNSVVSVPVQALRGFLNFEIFGYNMLSFFGSVVTLMIGLWVLKTFVL